MKNRSKEILSVRMPEDLKEHIKTVAFLKGNSTNDWIVTKLKRASGYASKGKLR